MAPVARLAMFDSRGSEEDESIPGVWRVAPDKAIMLKLATRCRRALRVEKYRADPKPVRITDGSVPRHSCVSALFGPLTMSPKVCIRDMEPDCCWTRVLSRSAGWRSKAEKTPVPRPAAKWRTEFK